MSPRQKAVGYVVFLVVLAGIGTILFFVGGPIARQLRRPKLIEPVVSVTVFRDDMHHVTCWLSTNGGISCLRDERSLDGAL